MEQNTLYIIVIILLLALLILSILGTEWVVYVFNFLLNVLKILVDFIMDFLGSLSNNTGDVINGTGDVVTTTSIFGIEIVDGIINSIGNMFKGQATPVSTDTNHLDIIIQTRGGNTNHVTTPDPVPSSANSSEGKWCFIGKNDDGSNTCVKLQANQSCQSNKVYNNQNECKNQMK
jgi:hypothetical protein